MIHFTVGALAVIFDVHDRVLLVHKTYANKGWQLPGGFLEEGEAAPHALKRELREELNLSVDEFSLAGIYHKIYERNLSFVFLCTHLTGKPTPDRLEISEAGFFQFDALPHGLSTRSSLVVRDCLSRPSSPLLWSFSSPETLVES